MPVTISDPLSQNEKQGNKLLKGAKLSGVKGQANGSAMEGHRMIDRRSILTAIASGATAAGAVSAIGGAALAGQFQPPAKGEPVKMGDKLRVFMRMLAMPNGTSVTTVEGMLYGVMLGGLPRPLIEFHSLVEIRVSEPKSGLFLAAQREATWLGSGTADDIESPFENPYTGKTVVPFGYVTPVNQYWFDQTGAYQSELPESRSRASERKWQEGGDTLWVTEERQNKFPSRIDESEFPSAFTGSFRESVDILTYQARRGDFLGHARFVPATVHMTSVSPWPHWLLMGRAPGHVLWSGHGEKYSRMVDVPDSVRTSCELFYPGFVSDPFGLDSATFGVAATMRRLRAAGRL